MRSLSLVGELGSRWTLLAWRRRREGGRNTSAPCLRMPGGPAPHWNPPPSPGGSGVLETESQPLLGQHTRPRAGSAVTCLCQSGAGRGGKLAPAALEPERVGAAPGWRNRAGLCGAAGLGDHPLPALWSRGRGGSRRGLSGPVAPEAPAAPPGLMGGMGRPPRTRRSAACSLFLSSLFSIFSLKYFFGLDLFLRVYGFADKADSPF